MKINFIKFKEAKKKNFKHLCTAMNARQMIYNDITYKLVLQGMN